MTLVPYYSDDAVTIYHGDCRDVLPELRAERVDLLFTDPPYGMQWSGQGATSQQANIAADGVRQGVRTVRQALFAASPLLDAGAHLLVFCHWQGWPDFYDAVSPHCKIRNALIWHKAAGGMGNSRLDYIRDYEVILYGTRSADREIAGANSYSNVISGFARVGSKRLHPSEKPLGLVKLLLERHCPPGGLVLDPFMGSGTVMEAARLTGRRAIGIEIEERYCEAAVSRLSQDVLDLGGLAA